MPCYVCNQWGGSDHWQGEIYLRPHKSLGWSIEAEHWPVDTAVVTDAIRVSTDAITWEYWLSTINQFFWFPLRFRLINMTSRGLPQWPVTCSHLEMLLSNKQGLYIKENDTPTLTTPASYWVNVCQSAPPQPFVFLNIQDGRPAPSKCFLSLL